MGQSVRLAGTLLSSPSVASGWVPAGPETAGATGTPDLDPWTDPLDGPVAGAPFPLCLHSAICISLRVGLVVSLLICAFLYIRTYHPIDQNRKSGRKDIRP